MSRFTGVHRSVYAQPVEPFLAFVSQFIKVSRVLWLRGDPLLMGAAIAYNSLFALVPLAIAFASLVSLLDLSGVIAERVADLLETTLPPDIAQFLLDIFRDSTTTVGTQESVVLVLAILVAFWSGSRAVYAVQKSLRLVQGTADDRGYLGARAVGILVTVGAGVSVMVGYSVLLFGESLWHELSAVLGFGSISLAQTSLSILLIVWAYGLLWAVYRFGPPEPVEHTAVVSGVVVAVLLAGSWFAFTLLPGDTRSAAAAFGVFGVILVLLYFIGVTVVAAPILVASAWSAWSDTSRRYSSIDAGDTVEPQGSTQRGEPPREASQ